MATRMNALSAYRPRIELGNLVENPELARYIARGTALNRGEIGNVLDEFNEAIIFYGVKGQPVKIEGVGVFTPVIKTDGTYRIGFRLDTSVSKALNVQGAFSGNVANSVNIGMTLEEMIERWNEEHPDDPIVE
jgi:nucleoid DNA-binding protein